MAITAAAAVVTIIYCPLNRVGAPCTGETGMDDNCHWSDPHWVAKRTGAGAVGPQP